MVTRGGRADRMLPPTSIREYQMRRIVLTFGLIAGAIMSVMMVLTTALVSSVGFDKGEIIGYTTMVVAFLMVFFGVKSYRDNVAGGSIGFGRALKVGLLITALASVCYVATWEVIYYEVWPDFGDKYAAHVIERARASGQTEAQIAQTTQKMAQFKELYRNPLINAAMTFLEPLPVGVVFALVTAGILRRKKGADALVAVTAP
jgi:uncharacterized protein DUF4199